MAVSAFGGKDEIAVVLLVDAPQESHGRGADRADGIPGLAMVEFEETLFDVHLWPGQAGDLVAAAAREDPEAGIFSAFGLTPSRSSSSRAAPRRVTSSSVRKRFFLLSVFRTAAVSHGLRDTISRRPAKLKTAERSRTTLRAAPSPPRTIRRLRGPTFRRARSGIDFGHPLVTQQRHNMIPKARQRELPRERLHGFTLPLAALDDTPFRLIKIDQAAHLHFAALRPPLGPSAPLLLRLSATMRKLSSFYAIGGKPRDTASGVRRWRWSGVPRADRLTLVERLPQSIGRVEVE